ncbi:HD domain-containing protein [Plantactinospora soyae]|uniref:Nucleotidyltransferase with HDIG domain n=1 Tax=Plantactinospora soyae TaxID=1544732 RepID=A0A927M6I2_9ACTN|nr:HD domain-containing protein [Plantactinospora soyae]MBE1487775.1 putative nucleotidyltransferase with HDIG domain [Plantactinospora soyae]
MIATALHRALADPGPPALRPLPPRAVELLLTLDAPPRLGAHLRAVHDVAARLLDWLRPAYPRLDVDHDAVLFGAATHDIGKTIHPEELSGPGSRHEPAGRELLLRHGVPAELARFAASHAGWDRPAMSTEELLVSLADKILKGRREPGLETLVVGRLAVAGNEQPWEAFMRLDDVLDGIGAEADARLAFQARYPTG